ncbi:MAG: tyrosine-type recombinase/integrase [Filifactoraceae bacterium]
MIKGCVEGYFQFLDSTDLAYNTRESYKRDISLYAYFLKENNISPENINQMTIKLFENSMNERPLSSVNRIMSSVRGFHRYLSRKGYIKEEPKFRSKPLNMYDYNIKDHILTESEIKTLFATIASLNSKYNIRDRVMFELLCKCGLKISEIENLKVDDVNTYLEYVSITSFASRLRVIPIDKGLNKRLKTYMDTCRNFIETNEKNRPYLFLNKNGEKMTRQGIWKVIKKYANKSGIEKNINSNTFRLSLAYNLVSNGADTSVVNKYLGNKSYSIIAKVSEQNAKFRSSILKFNIDLEGLL